MLHHEALVVRIETRRWLRFGYAWHARFHYGQTYTLRHVVYGMLAGYGVGSAFGMDLGRRRTLAIEIGMQNAGLGTVLALNHFGEEAAMPAAVFVFVCIITASAMAAVWQRTTREDTPG